MPQDFGPQQLPTWPVLLSLYAMAILIVSKESSTSSYIKSQLLNPIRAVRRSCKAYFGQVQRSVVVDHVAVLHNNEVYKVQVSIDQVSCGEVLTYRAYTISHVPDIFNRERDLPATATFSACGCSPFSAHLLEFCSDPVGYMVSLLRFQS